MLVRVDVATSAASGVLRVTLSHHPAGFAPYRIDNCSLVTLHARQYRWVGGWVGGRYSGRGGAVVGHSMVWCAVVRG